MVFEAFPALNDYFIKTANQEAEDAKLKAEGKEGFGPFVTYETLSKLAFTGNPKLIHKEAPKKVLTQEEKDAIEAKKNKEPDPLESTEEEDPEANIERFDLTEINRLHYHVLAIENECHIVPHGAVKLTTKHEVTRNEAFLGLTGEDALKMDSYMHFRTV